MLFDHQSMLVSILNHNDKAINLWLAFLGFLGTVYCISSSYADKTSHCGPLGFSTLSFKADNSSDRVI